MSFAWCLIGCPSIPVSAWKRAGTIDSYCCVWFCVSFFMNSFENILRSVFFFFLPLSRMVHCERTDDIYIHTHMGGRIFPNVVLKCWSTFPKFVSKGNCCGFRSWHLAELHAASLPFSSWRKRWRCLTSLSTSKSGRGDPRVSHVPSGMLRLRSQE